MTIHREGYRIIGISALLFGIINVLSFYFFDEQLRWVAFFILVITFCSLLFIMLFFRIPQRSLTFAENKIVAPADGKVVVIEEITDEEYFHDKRIQVSIFMSPVNVHVNRVPVSGTVVYNNYY